MVKYIKLNCNVMVNCNFLNIKDVVKNVKKINLISHLYMTDLFYCRAEEEIIN